jgi:hypothetical protein
MKPHCHGDNGQKIILNNHKNENNNNNKNKTND